MNHFEKTSFDNRIQNTQQPKIRNIFLPIKLLCNLNLTPIFVKGKKPTWSKPRLCWLGAVELGGCNHISTDRSITISQPSLGGGFKYVLHPRNFTWNLKNDCWKMSFLLGLPIFRGYVKFQGCIILLFSPPTWGRFQMGRSHQPVVWCSLLGPFTTSSPSWSLQEWNTSKFKCSGYLVYPMTYVWGAQWWNMQVKIQQIIVSMRCPKWVSCLIGCFF